VLRGGIPRSSDCGNYVDLGQGGQRREPTLRPATPNHPATRVLLADPDTAFIGGLTLLLQRVGLTVVASATDDETAVALAAEHEPDVAVVDIQPPAMSGGRTVRRLVEASPRSRVLVLTDSAEAADLLETVAAGACGYLLKGSPTREIVACIQATATGSSLILPSTASQLRDAAGSNGRKGDPAPSSCSRTGMLSSRELEVLRLVAEGHDNAEIAGELQISPATAKSHVSRILAKLSAQNRVQAAVYAVRAGLV
jgi:DNA-binding NarL/FixJ family response regulator